MRFTQVVDLFDKPMSEDSTGWVHDRARQNCSSVPVACEEAWRMSCYCATMCVMWSMVAVGGEDFKMSSPDRTSEDDIEAKTKHTRHALVLLSCQVVDRNRALDRQESL